MHKNYPVKKDWLIHGFIVVLILFPVLSFWIDPAIDASSWWILILLLLPLLFVLWAYFSTKYWIENNKLHYRSMFIKGKILIEDIKYISCNKTSWVGVRPALATKGLIIHYQKFEEIYLAPKNNEELVKDLLAINPSIKIR